MNTIILRHYAPETTDCRPIAETADTIKKLALQLGGKLQAMGFPVSYERAEADNEKQLNLVTLSCSDIGLEETPLEDIIQAEATMDPCDSPDGECKTCRTIIFEGERFQSIPPGLITDALLRVAFSAMSTCGDGCASCGGG